jgi:exodeoxyribonuclease VII large subunit
MNSPTSSTYQNILTVSQLNHKTSHLLAEHFLSVLVEGEISNLSTPSSGHLYFSLKDTLAQVRCAMFKTKQRRLGFKPENGKQVIIKAQVSLYEPRGDFQLIVEHIEEAGDGALRRTFEALKIKLSEEGLFDFVHKKPIPALPHSIGIITSPTGAAIRDIVTVLKRRFSLIPIIIYPVVVQGTNAKYEITKAIALANEHKQCDVIILGRGGGSLEDLSAFNEEMVARAIFASTIPIISAVGHETDFTIADFVADLRAATPSSAAEHASPDQQELLTRFAQLEVHFHQQLQRKLTQKQHALSWLTKRLQQQNPGQKLLRNSQRLDELEIRLKQAILTRLQRNQSLTEAKSAKLWQHNPRIKLHQYHQKQVFLYKRLLNVMQYKLATFNKSLTNYSQTLHAISPLATLNRGYALVIKQPSGQLISSTKQVKPDDIIETQLAEGRFTSQVKTLI